ncbi:MAG: hypothetical protein ACI9S8_002008 [Chlamydiales bacterium]
MNEFDIEALEGKLYPAHFLAVAATIVHRRLTPQKSEEAKHDIRFKASFDAMSNILEELQKFKNAIEMIDEQHLEIASRNFDERFKVAVEASYAFCEPMIHFNEGVETFHEITASLSRDGNSEDKFSDSLKNS